MQLASQSGDPDHKISPSIRAALIDSLFENPAPLFASIVFVAVAAALTAVKTGEHLIWACVALLIVAGAVRLFGLRRHHARKSTLTPHENPPCNKHHPHGPA